MKERMISVVTPSLNQTEYIERTILSVINQSYAPFEHIVIDGGSNDGTIEILEKYRHLIWTSEKDRGQAHAVNKGFRLAKGDIIGWLNSDDVYTPGTFKKVNAVFQERPDIDMVFSHCLWIDKDDNIIRFLEGRNPARFPVLNHPCYIPQPTVFLRRKVLDKTGYLNEAYSYVMDFDFWRRISKNHKILFIRDIFASFRYHNASKTAKYLKSFKYESRKSFFTNGGSVFSPYYFETFIKPLIISILVYNPIVKKLFFHGKK
jgi:glycosyltransferase involved in cell wall biosynthesis